MKSGLAFIFLLCFVGAANAHSCDQDAITRATPLLKLEFGDADAGMTMAIEDTVKTIAPIKALKGNGKFDVLEVWGHIYKADYRMHFIYAEIPGSCTLMGQEILEASDPY